jgi:hypothetical protein
MGGFDFMDTGFVAAEEIVVRADLGVDAHGRSIPWAHLDAAGRGLYIEIDRAVDGQRAVEGAVPFGGSRLHNQPSEG